MEEKSKSKKYVDDIFRSDIKIADFAKGLAHMPQLGDLLRLAGLQDGRTMAGVKITAAKMDALRAQAVGDPRASEKAAQAEARATKIAKAMKNEEARLRDYEDLLGPLVGLAGKFRLYGRVMDQSGNPVPNAKVEIVGKDTGVVFAAHTDENGVYDLALPVGKDAEKANEGEEATGKIELDGNILQQGLQAFIKEGTVMHRLLTVPLIETISDLAMPIAAKRKAKPSGQAPTKSTKVSDIVTRPKQNSKRSSR